MLRLAGRQVLLGMKKRGFGAGKYNGFGGKIEEGESFEAAAIRELEEESGLSKPDLRSAGYLVFRMLESKLFMKVHVYQTWSFDGEPKESEEMRPEWFDESSIPFDSMWADDKYWFPHLLQEKTFLGRFDYKDDESITDYSLTTN